MPEKEFGTILTNIGNAAITNAMLTGQKVNWDRICVGDGGGYDYIPDADQKALRNKLWEGPIADMSLVEGNDNQIIIHGVIPSDVGGFWIREIGILDANDNLVAVGNTPAQEKATGANKVIMDMDLFIHVLVSNASVVNVVVDPTVTIASKSDLEHLREEILSQISGITVVESISKEEIDEITGMPIPDAGNGESIVVISPITDGEIDEITGTPAAPTVIVGEGLSDDDVAKLIDDDPGNDPMDNISEGALSQQEILEILGG